MSTPGQRRDISPAILVASLCVALVACEPNKAPAEGQVQQPAAKSAEQGQQQAAVPQKLDTAARTAALSPTKMCNLEFLDDGKFGSEAVAPKNPAHAEFRGWIGDETTGTRPANARLRFATLNHHQVWEAPLGAPVVRKDVAKYVKVPTLEDAGFKAAIDLTSLPQGEYRIYLVFDGSSGGYRCDNGRHILR